MILSFAGLRDSRCAKRRATGQRDRGDESARVIRLEQIAATNTEARIRSEAQLGELRDGQAELKAMLLAHDSATKRSFHENKFLAARLGKVDNASCSV